MGKIRDWLGSKFGAKSYTVQMLVADDGFMVAPSFTGGSLYTVYTQAIWTYICASRISQDIATFPAVVQTREAGTSKWVTDPDHELNALLRRPYGMASWAPRLNWRQMLSTGVLRQELGGNQFYRIERAVDRLLALQLYIRELQADADPNTGLFTEYLVTGTQTKVPVDQVVNIFHANPDSTWSGVSPATPAEQAIRVDYAANRRMRYDMETRVQPGLVFKVKALFTMTKKQREKEEQHLAETFEGAVNAGKSLVVGDNTTVEKPPVMDSGDIPAQAAVARDAIISAFDISPPMVGVLRDAKYANLDKAARVQFANCIYPRLLNIYDTFNDQAVIPVYGDKTRLWFDMVGSPLGLAALAERGEVAQIYQDLGWPAKQLNDRFALEMPEFDGWDKPNMGAVIAGRVPGEGSGDPAPDTDDVDDDTESDDE
jgi:phage portal protein BeeE